MKAEFAIHKKQILDSPQLAEGVFTGGHKSIFRKRHPGNSFLQKFLSRSKIGFGVPIDHWFRHELHDFAYDMLLSPRSIQRGYFKRAVVERLLHEHINKVRAWHYPIWNLLMLELWHRMFMDHTENRVLPFPPSILDIGNFWSLPLLPVRIHSCVAARSYRALFPCTTRPHDARKRHPST